MARSVCDHPSDLRQAESFMPRGFPIGNFESRRLVQRVSFQGGDRGTEGAQNRNVTDSEPDWQLKAWMTYRGKRQADLVKELGWAKGRANKFYHGTHPYRRDVLNELSAWLEIQPFEMLMQPDEAIRLRRLRAAAFEVAANNAEAAPPMEPIEAGRKRA